MELMFGKLPVGTGFAYYGTKYCKIAPSMARNERGCGSVFLGETPVTVEVTPAELLPWEPDELPWFARIKPAPGQGPRQGGS